MHLLKQQYSNSDPILNWNSHTVISMCSWNITTVTSMECTMLLISSLDDDHFSMKVSTKWSTHLSILFCTCSTHVQYECQCKEICKLQWFFFMFMEGNFLQPYVTLYFYYSSHLRRSAILHDQLWACMHACTQIWGQDSTLSASWGNALNALQIDHDNISVHMYIELEF